MHRQLLCAGKGEEVDHIDGNGLNNQRSNLRIATRAQNAHNTRRPKTNTSGHKGVYWSKCAKSWCAMICSNGKRKYLGLFDNVDEAGKAYEMEARLNHGEFYRGAPIVKS